MADAASAHVSTALANPPDLYADLAQPDRVWLRTAAATLRAHLGRTARDVLDCGEMLRRARRRLGRDRWQPWLNQEAQIARRTAYRYMRVAGVFADLAPETLSRFTPGALYALVDQSCPAELRAFAVEQAGEGVEVTPATVAEWMGAFRNPLPAKVKLAAVEPPTPKPDAAVERAPENWRLLCGLLGEADNSVHIAQTIDVENGERTVSVLVLPAEGSRRSVTAPTLEEAIAEAAGAVRTKQCRGPYKEVRTLFQFSHQKNAKDGRNKYCLACERTRVKNYLARKAASGKAG